MKWAVVCSFGVTTVVGSSLLLLFREEGDLDDVQLDRSSTETQAFSANYEYSILSHI